MEDVGAMSSSPKHSVLALSFWRLPVLLGLAVFVLDQLSKTAILRHWPMNTQTAVIPGFFSIVHFRNPGAAWGLFADHTGLLALLSAVVMAAMVFWFDRLVEGFPERAMALGAVFGGIAGNLVDRVVHGEVVDFILVYWRTFQWPAFNVADSAISCGVTIFVLSSFLRQQPTVATACPDGAPPAGEPPASSP